MLVVAAVLLVLENDNNYKCCQSENCNKKYVVRANSVLRTVEWALTFSPPTQKHKDTDTVVPFP